MLLQETIESSIKNRTLNDSGINKSTSRVLRATDLTSPSDEKELWDRMLSEEELLIGHMFESKKMTAAERREEKDSYWAGRKRRRRLVSNKNLRSGLLNWGEDQS